MYKLKQKKSRFLLLLLLIVWNLSTLFCVAPLKENLSYLNTLGLKPILMIWGCSAAAYFYVYTTQLMNKYHYTNRIGKLLLLLSCTLMILSVLLPYDPQSFPEVSKWHIRIAMWGTALYVALFFHFLFDVYKKDVLFFQKSMPFYSMLVAFDLLLFLFYGSVSTLLEISFTIGMAALLFYMKELSS